MRRRILLLITDLNRGGTPTVVRELATRLQPFAHVEVACLKPMGPVGEELIAAGVEVTSFNATRPTELKRTVRSLVDLLREKQIDTLFSFLIHANVIAARAIKRLPNVRVLQSIQTTQPRPRWHWWLQARVHESAARIIVPSESVAQRAMQRAGVPRAKLMVIPNAIDIAAFDGMSAPLMDRNHERGAPATAFRVGFVGRLDPVKRIPDLVAAIARLPATNRLEIFGEGDERETIERTIDRLGMRSRVTLHGQIADPREAYRQIDALVLPSEAEGFGLVLIEAMAAGVPVIGTDVDGIRDVIEHEQTGLLTPPADPQALARTIARLGGDAALRERLTTAAKIEVERRFAWPAVIAQYRQVLQID